MELEIERNYASWELFQSSKTVNSQVPKQTILFESLKVFSVSLTRNPQHNSVVKAECQNKTIKTIMQITQHSEHTLHSGSALHV